MLLVRTKFIEYQFLNEKLFKTKFNLKPIISETAIKSYNCFIYLLDSIMIYSKLFMMNMYFIIFKLESKSRWAV